VVFSIEGAVVDEFSGSEDHSTSNRMELTAVREAIQRAPSGATLEILMDSRNVVGWLADGWKRNNPAVAAMCREIDELRAERTTAEGGPVTFKHLRGHNGDPLNGRADQLARSAIQRG
jgi:ribonuclease HI